MICLHLHHTLLKYVYWSLFRLYCYISDAGKLRYEGSHTPNKYGNFFSFIRVLKNRTIGTLKYRSLVKNCTIYL